MKAVSLFSGIGGIDLAMSYAGFNVIAQVEIDKDCREVLAYHAPKYWRDSTQFTDVRTFGRQSVTGDVAFIAGGFPCQPFSIAGSRKGASDNRNLWGEFARIIGEFRPRAVLLENVPAICSSYVDADGVEQPAYALTVIADLAEMGYVAKWGVVSAEDAGAMHRRDRWFCVAYLSDPSSDGQHQQTDEPNTNYRGTDNQTSDKQGLHIRNPIKSSGQISNAHSERQQQLQRRVSYEWRWTGNRRQKVVNTEASGLYAGIHKRRYEAKKPKSTSNGKGRRQRAVTISQSRLGNTSDGIPGWLAEHRRVAPPNEPQYTWEHPRTVPKKVTKHDAKIKALGNAVFVPTVFAITKSIYEVLNNAKR